MEKILINYHLRFKKAISYLNQSKEIKLCFNHCKAGKVINCFDQSEDSENKTVQYAKVKINPKQKVKINQKQKVKINMKQKS